MFRAMLYTQWRWGRLALLASSLLLFALPMYSVQGLALVSDGRLSAGDFLDDHAAFGALYPLLAGLIALVLAVNTWAADHAGRHVYALSLPVARWHFVLLRLGAALTLLLLPVAAFWIGALASASSATVPLGLQVYPSLLALRFALALVLGFGFFFSISSGSTRTAGWILALLAAWVLGQLLISAFGGDADVISPILNALFVWPGPFDVFTGRWVLIDV